MSYFDMTSAKSSISCATIWCVETVNVCSLSVIASGVASEPADFVLAVRLWRAGRWNTSPLPVIRPDQSENRPAMTSLNSTARFTSALQISSINLSAVVPVTLAKRVSLVLYYCHWCSKLLGGGPEMPKTHDLFRDLPCTSEGCAHLRVAKGLCRQHYQQARRSTMATKPCADCGKGILPEYTRCFDCQRKGPNARFCLDCGTRLSHASHKETTRCWPCWTKARNPYGPICTTDGCDQQHFAKGLCNGHYMTMRARSKRTGHGRYFLKWVALQPCQLCNYARLPSEVARIIPGSQGGKYERGNVMALCARCHREVDAGITTAPPALALPE